VKVTWLVLRNGLTNAISMSIRSGDDPVITIDPSPALRLPFHA